MARNVLFVGGSKIQRGAIIEQAMRPCAQLLLLAAFAGIITSCASFQRRMLYYPRVGTMLEMENLAARGSLERWTNQLGENIGWKRLTFPRSPAGEVLITHGNGDCAASRAIYADALQRADPLDIYILEYPGFGDRPGKPSESALFNASENGFAALPNDRPIYLLGESLGTGVAAYLASHHAKEVAGMLLISPYNNLDDVAQYHLGFVPAAWFVREHFTSDSYLKGYHGPLAILCGSEDQVVPAKFSRKLYESYVGPKQLWQVTGADHASVVRQPESFWSDVVGFWRRKGEGSGIAD